MSQWLAAVAARIELREFYTRLSYAHLTALGTISFTCADHNESKYKGAVAQKFRDFRQ